MSKPSRFKRKPKLSTGDITPEEWLRLNERFFGKDNIDWDAEEVENDYSDETEELNFDH